MERERALEIVKKHYFPDGVDGTLSRALETLIPELRESEDERIRKTLINMVKRETGFTGFPSQGQVLAYLEKQKEPKDKGEISDGYHTFNELYFYRMLYNAAFFNLLPKEWVHKSKKHHDGEECFGGGWFIVMANLPTGQISNHYELKDWDLFQIPEKEVADEWDGHTPQEAAERLHKYLLEKQKKQQEQKPQGVYVDCTEHPEWYGMPAKEQQPAEWSEDIIRKAVKEVGLTQHQIDWFKTNVFPPKQEWSEEDKLTIDWACAHLAEYARSLKNINELKANMLYELSSKLNLLSAKIK